MRKNSQYWRDASFETLENLSSRGKVAILLLCYGFFVIIEERADLLLSGNDVRHCEKEWPTVYLS